MDTDDLDPLNEEIAEAVFNDIAAEGFDCVAVETLFSLVEDGEIDALGDVLSYLAQKGQPDWAAVLCRMLSSGSSDSPYAVADYSDVAAAFAYLVDMDLQQPAQQIAQCLFDLIDDEAGGGYYDCHTVSCLVGALVVGGFASQATAVLRGLLEDESEAGQTFQVLVPQVLGTLLDTDQKTVAKDLARRLLLPRPGAAPPGSLPLPPTSAAGDASKAAASQQFEYENLAWVLVQMAHAGRPDWAALLCDSLLAQPPAGYSAASLTRSIRTQGGAECAKAVLDALNKLDRGPAPNPRTLAPPTPPHGGPPFPQGPSPPSFAPHGAPAPYPSHPSHPYNHHHHVQPAYPMHPSPMHPSSMPYTPHSGHQPYATQAWGGAAAEYSFPSYRDPAYPHAPASSDYEYGADYGSMDSYGASPYNGQTYSAARPYPPAASPHAYPPGPPPAFAAAGRSQAQIPVGPRSNVWRREPEAGASTGLAASATTFSPQQPAGGRGGGMGGPTSRTWVRQPEPAAAATGATQPAGTPGVTPLGAGSSARAIKPPPPAQPVSTQASSLPKAVSDSQAAAAVPATAVGEVERDAGPAKPAADTASQVEGSGADTDSGSVSLLKPTSLSLQPSLSLVASLNSKSLNAKVFTPGAQASLQATTSTASAKPTPRVPTPDSQPVGVVSEPTTESPSGDALGGAEAGEVAHHDMAAMLPDDLLVESSREPSSGVAEGPPPQPPPALPSVAKDQGERAAAAASAEPSELGNASDEVVQETEAKPVA